MAENKYRRAAGSCDNDKCAVNITVESGVESPAEALPDEHDWHSPGSFFDCPVCGGSVTWLEWDSRASWEASR